MKKNLSIHLSRIVCKSIDIWKKHEKEANKVIPHPYIQFTSQKTETVGTEMLFKNQNKGEDVPDILNFYQVFFFLKKKYNTKKRKKKMKKETY